MKPRLALIGIGRSVELVDLVATRPFQKKVVIRHYKRSGRLSAECLWIEAEDWEGIDAPSGSSLTTEGTGL